MFKILNIIKANTEISRLEDTLTKAQADVTELSNQLAEKSAEIEDYKKAIAAYPLATQDFEAKLVELTKANEEAISELNKQLVEAQASTAKQAQNIVASIGISEGVIVDEVAKEQMTGAKAKELFEAMPMGDERTAFYNEHKKLILQASNIRV